VLLWPKLFPSAPDQVAVPQLVNLPERQARAAIGDAGLTVNDVEYENSDSVATGSVIRQDPKPDTYVDPGTGVQIVLSSGAPQRAVPNVVGMKLKEARAALDDAGLKAKVQEVDSDDPKNQVVEANPAPGVMVNSGQEVTLSVSKGPRQVPDVRGKKQGEAEQILRDAGFDPQVRQAPDTTEPKGTVVDQFPQPPKTAKQGDQVLIFVSTYEPPQPSSTPPTPCITPTPGIPLAPTDPPTCEPTEEQ
jgi:serine/threonine-protein kinase